jgi:DNA-directed RNA polymerase subunit L
MEISVLRSDKNEIEFSISDVTFAEILRVYLNKDPSVKFVAWKKEHSTRDPVMLVKSDKDVKKVIESASNAVISDLDQFEVDFKKLK